MVRIAVVAVQSASLLGTLVWASAAGVPARHAAAHAAVSAQPKSVAIRAGRILDVKTGTYVVRQMIWIEGERIRQIGAESDVSRQLPGGTPIIDLSDATVLPGLIDCHIHLTVSPASLASATAAAQARQSTGVGDRDPSARELPEFAKQNARITIEGGFTTVRNLGSLDNTDIALRDANAARNVIGPRMLVSGAPLTGRVKGVAYVSAAVSENVKRGVDVIKFFATGGVLLGNDITAETYSPEEMRAIVETAHAMGRKTAAHAHGSMGMKDAVLAGVDSIEHGSGITEEIIQLMKQRGTYLVPTVYVGEWYQENAKNLGLPAPQAIPGRSENLARAFREGVKVAFGTDSGTFPHGLNGKEFSSMVALGMTPKDVLRAATVNAAELLGWSDRVGTLEPGKLADVIAVDGDPLTDVKVLEHIRFVMKGGEVVKGR
jgi:imidazolonepropionase-like amidohydrolase